MQVNLNSLHRKAIDCALKSNWKEAVEANQQVLEKAPGNLEAKNRLGRAYIQLREFTKARKMFKEILDVDPVNTIARKNFELAAKGKREKTNSHVSSQSLIMESGTTYELEQSITAKGISAKDFTPGEEIEVKTNKKCAKFYKKMPRKGEVLIFETKLPLVTQRLNAAKKENAVVSAMFVRGADTNVTLLLKSSVPVFPGQKQGVRPYLKKGSLDEEESEIEIPAQEKEMI